MTLATHPAPTTRLAQQNKAEFKAMLKGTNPAQTDDFTDAMVTGTIIQLSKQAIFRGHADASKGLDLDGLIISYTKLPGNDVDKDAISLGWVTKEDLAKASAE